MADSSRREEPRDQQDGAGEGFPPEVYLLMLVGIGGFSHGLQYLGEHYAWYWSALVLVVGVGLLLVWGRFSNKPQREREAARQRDLAAIDTEIAKHGMSAERRHRRQEREKHHRRIADEARAAERSRSWRDKPISWPRRVVRWVSLGLLIAILIPLGIVFYGTLFLLPSAVVFAVAYPVVGVWALVPAVLTLPVGGWIVWWWVNRVPASTAQTAGIAGASGV